VPKETKAERDDLLKRAKSLIDMALPSPDNFGVVIPSAVLACAILLYLEHTKPTRGT
jgi:hypothetical protein